MQPTQVDPILELKANVTQLAQSMQQLQAQMAIHTELMRRALEGKWDGAHHGADSAEADLYALNPTLQGKVTVVPFDQAG
jgi:hypothetical protein